MEDLDFPISTLITLLTLSPDTVVRWVDLNLIVFDVKYVAAILQQNPELMPQLMELKVIKMDILKKAVAQLDLDVGTVVALFQKYPDMMWKIFDLKAIKYETIKQAAYILEPELRPEYKAKLTLQMLSIIGASMCGSVLFIYLVIYLFDT